MNSPVSYFIGYTQQADGSINPYAEVSIITVARWYRYRLNVAGTVQPCIDCRPVPELPATPSRRRLDKFLSEQKVNILAMVKIAQAALPLPVKNDQEYNRLFWIIKDAQEKESL